MRNNQIRRRLRSLGLDAGALAATGLLIVAFYWPRLSPRASFAFGDLLSFNVPHRVYATRIVQTGRLPEWSDMTFGGYPFLSDPQAAVFFPPFLATELAGWTPDTSARFDVLPFSFVLFCGLGATLLARALCVGRLGAVAAGVFFGLNGYMVGHLQHIGITATIACSVWAMAFLVWALRRQSNSSLWAAGLCFASGMLAGHFQMALFAFYAVAAGGLYLVVRAGAAHRRLAWAGRDMMRLAAILAIAVAGAVVQILPTLEFLRYSTRQLLSLDAATVFSLPLVQLAGLLMPGLYKMLFWRAPPGNRWDVCWHTWGMEGVWEFQFWFGIIALALILFGLFVCGRRPSNWLLGCCFVFVLIAAMGRDFGLYRVLYDFVPGFRQIRIPPRMMWVGYLAGALLIGRGLDALCLQPAHPWRRRAARLTGGILIGIAGVLLYFLVRARVEAQGWQPALEKLLVLDPHYRIGVDRSASDFLTDIGDQMLVGVGFLAAALLWLWAAGRLQRWRRTAACSAIGLMWLELGVYGFERNIEVGNPGFTNPVLPVHALLQDPVAGRLHSLVPQGDANTAEVSGIPMTIGYNPMILLWTEAMLPPNQPGYGQRWYENILDVWNVSHVVAPPAKRSVRLPLTGRNTEIEMAAGYVQLAAATRELTSASTLRLKSTYPARLHVLTGGIEVAREQNGTTVGVVTLLGGHGEEVTSYALRLGIETADWRYHDAKLRPAPAHRAPAVAFTDRGDEKTSATSWFIASFNLLPTAPLRAVRISSVLASPRGLAVAGVIEETATGETIVHPAVEGLGYEAVPSRDARQWVYFRRPSPPGWAWLVPEARPVSSEYGWVPISNILQQSDWDARRTVLVEQETFGKPQEIAGHNAADPAGFRGSVDVEHPYPEFWRMRTHSNDRGWLFVSKTWYTGWRGTLDGQPVKLVRADGPFTALPVPEGEHVVELRYTTPWLWLGAPISAIAWIAGLIGIVTGWGPPRRPIPVPEDSSDCR
jgi:hypothetical protein